MNMRRNDIDDLFNSGLRNQHFEIEDVYFKDLDKRLNKKKKKPILFWLSSGFGGIILLFGIYFSFFNPEKTIHSTLVKKSSISTASEKITPSKTNSVQNDNVTKEQTKDVISNKKDPLKHRFLDGHSLKRNKLDIKKMPLSLNEYKVTKLTNKNSTKLNNDGHSSSNKKTTSLVLGNEKKEPVLDKNNTVIQEASNHTPVVGNETHYDSSKIDSTKSALITNQANNSSVPNQQVDLSLDPPNKGANLFLSLEAGMNFNFAEYQGMNADYYRTSNQENATVNYEFNANVLIRDKFFLGVGVGLNSQNYDYNYTTSSVSYDTTFLVDSTYVLDYYIYQQSVITDSVYYYVYNTTADIDSTLSNSSFQGVTQAKYITVPLNVGYSFTHKKLMLGLFVTTRINILQNTRGGIYSNNEFNLFGSSSNSLFKKSYLSFSFKANVAYNVYKNIYLHSSFSYSPYLNPVAEIPTMQRRLQVFNVGLGITYKL